MTLEQSISPTWSFPAGDDDTALPDNLAGKAARLLEEVSQAMARDLVSAHAAALQLVTLLAPSNDQPVMKTGGLAPWQARRIERVMQQRIEAPLRLIDLADVVSLSPGHFSRAFKQTCGETPHAYLMSLRLDLAKQLMLTTGEPLSQIALACGLSDQAHLTKLFRRRIGVTPSAWRRNHLDGDQGSDRGREGRGGRRGRLRGGGLSGPSAPTPDTEASPA